MSLKRGVESPRSLRLRGDVFSARINEAIP